VRRPNRSSSKSLRRNSNGDGDSISNEFPLYLEGTAAFSRYDPTFVATNGTETRVLPVKWNSVSGADRIG
jgi:hypothetical protein